MDKWPKVAIIILNWNGWRDTIECLESLQRITYPNYQVIVVDNGSTDNSVARIKAWVQRNLPASFNVLKYNQNIKPLEWVEYTQVVAEDGGDPENETSLKTIQSSHCLVLIKLKENLGFSGGNNVGIRYSLEHGTDYLLLLNNDTVVNPGFLEPLVKAGEQNPNLGIVVPKILYYTEPSRIWAAGGYRSWVRGSGFAFGQNRVDCARYSQDRYVSFASGCAMLLKAEAIRRVGLFCEDYFLYLEDVDYCQRMQEKGFRIRYVGRSRVYHKVGSSTSQKDSLLYYQFRNRLFFMKRHAPRELYVLFLLYFTFTVAIKLLIWKVKGCKGKIRATKAAISDFLHGQMGKATFELS